MKPPTGNKINGIQYILIVLKKHLKITTILRVERIL